jgi:hypothetical protein
MYSSAGNSEIQILFHMINYGRCSPGLPKEIGSVEGGRDQREKERTITGCVYALMEIEAEGNVGVGVLLCSCESGAVIIKQKSSVLSIHILATPSYGKYQDDLTFAENSSLIYS